MSCYGLIEVEKAHHGVSLLCRVPGCVARRLLRVGRQGGQPTSPADAELLKVIRQVHRDSRSTYGAPQVHAEIRQTYDVRVGRKRVAWLLRSAGRSAVTDEVDAG